MSPQYLLLVVLTVHVQHKQVVTQAADRDAWGGTGVSLQCQDLGRALSLSSSAAAVAPSTRGGCRGWGAGQGPHCSRGSREYPSVGYSKGQKLQQRLRELLCRNGQTLQLGNHLGEGRGRLIGVILVTFYGASF